MRTPEPSTEEPHILPPNEARALARFVARQLASGEITETQAYNHVADISVMTGNIPMQVTFDLTLRRLGGVKLPKPIPMRLPCPACGALHIDEGPFATKPHHTHSCQECGLTWRPAIVHTVGVRFLPGFRNAEPEGKDRAP